MVMTKMPFIGCVWEMDSAEFRFEKSNLVVCKIRKKNRMRNKHIRGTEKFYFIFNDFNMSSIVFCATVFPFGGNR